MKEHKRLWSSRLLQILISSVLILSALHLFMQYLNLEIFYQQVGLAYELSNRLDLDDESSIPTGFSLILFLLISAAAMLAAYLEKDKARKRLWKVFAAAGILFSLDEASGIHEFILQSIHVLFYKDAAPTGSNNAWLLVAPIILLVGFWLIWKMLRLLPLRTVVIFGFAGIIFLTGAVGIDLLISINERETFLNQGIMVAIEETLELIGAVTALYAIANYIELKYHAQIERAFNIFLSVIIFFAVFNIINPDAFIARQNIDRFNKTGKLDIYYLSSLSEDAVPAVSGLLSHPNDRLRKNAANILYNKQHSINNNYKNWQSFNLARERAIDIIDSKENQIEAGKSFFDFHEFNN